jgi:hypothetical protein
MIKKITLGALVGTLLATSCTVNRDPTQNQKVMPVPSHATIYSPDDDDPNILGLKRQFVDYGSDGSLEQVWMIWNRNGIIDGPTHRTPVQVLSPGDPGFKEQKQYFENELKPYFVKTWGR